MSFSAQAPPASLAIVGAAVIDGTGAPPFTGTVVVRGDRITAVGTNVEVPPGARVIRGEGLTLVPGLFDLHTHLPYSAISGLQGDWGKILNAYLYCGVTSVVDFGTYPETFEPMRRLMTEGVITGPRLSLAVRMTTPGGHGAEGGRGDFFSLEVQTPREAKAAVRRVLAYKPDVIKVFTDGWRYGTAPDMTSMDPETLKALVDEAHVNHIPVLTHTVTLDKAKVAARAGVDVVAHAIGDAPVDEEVIDLFKSKGVTYVNTLAVYEGRDAGPINGLLKEVLEPAAQKVLNGMASVRPPSRRNPARARRWRTANANLKAMHTAGVAIGVGTDSGVSGTYHGWSSLRELKLMVEAGLTPLEAITAATGASAKAIGVEGERGTIAVGKLADLVLVEGSPHRQIEDIERLRFVFLGGQEVDRMALAKGIASSELTPLPARKLKAALIDDMEREDGRSSIGTLRVNSTDDGSDHSRMIFGRTESGPADHVLTIQARMAEKNHPFVRLNIPLSPGAIEPVDVRSYKGIRFAARGEGTYQLIVPTRSVRDYGFYRMRFSAAATWKTVTVPFTQLQQEDARTPVPWTGEDVQMLSFEIARPSATGAWLELDNVRLY